MSDQLSANAVEFHPSSNGRSPSTSGLDAAAKEFTPASSSTSSTNRTTMSSDTPEFVPSFMRNSSGNTADSGTNNDAHHASRISSAPLSNTAAPFHPTTATGSTDFVSSSLSNQQPQQPSVPSTSSVTTATAQGRTGYDPVTGSFYPTQPARAPQSQSSSGNNAHAQTTSSAKKIDLFGNNVGSTEAAHHSQTNGPAMSTGTQGFQAQQANHQQSPHTLANASPMMNPYLPSPPTAVDATTGQPVMQMNAGMQQMYMAREQMIGDGIDGGAPHGEWDSPNGYPSNPITMYTQQGVHGDHRSRPIQAPAEAIHYMYSVGGLIMSDAASTFSSEYSYFSSEDLKKETLRQRAILEYQAVVDPSIPEEVDSYHSLVPLETPSAVLPPSKVFGYQTMAYKAFHVDDGKAYFLRRISGFQSSQPKAMAHIQKWRKITHSSVVAVHEVFNTKAFGDNSLIIVSEYHPAATTLEQQLYSYTAPVGEEVLWDYIIQLTAVIRTAHMAKLAVGTIHPSKILILPRDHVLVGGMGILNMMHEEAKMTQKPLHEAQKEDFIGLGNVIMQLTHVPHSQEDWAQAAAKHLKRHAYHDDVIKLLRVLFSTTRVGVEQIMPIIGARFFKKIERQTLATEVVTAEYSKEVYNGHLFRLMTKLMMLTDRPTTRHDKPWRAGGSNYMLQLFKNYVFHQVREDGTPFLDVAHVVQCLAKLDAASPERVCLMSQDGKNVMVVSYADLNKTMQTAFHALRQKGGNNAAVPTPTSATMMHHNHHSQQPPHHHHHHHHPGMMTSPYS